MSMLLFQVQRSFPEPVWGLAAEVTAAKAYDWTDFTKRLCDRAHPEAVAQDRFHKGV